MAGLVLGTASMATATTPERTTTLFGIPKAETSMLLSLASCAGLRASTMSMVEVTALLTNRRSVPGSKATISADVEPRPVE